MASKIDKAHNEQLKKDWALQIESHAVKIAKLKFEMDCYSALNSLMNIIETAKCELPDYLRQYHVDELLEDGKSIMVFSDYSLIEHSYGVSRRVQIVKHAISSHKSRFDVKTNPSWAKEALRSAKIVDDYNNIKRD